MAESACSRTTGFKRCAVCKIDLKGRFVYIDEEAEKLLGCTKEELFGRSVLDFLDRASQEVIDEFLTQRNHYESFYDTTMITIVGRDDLPVEASAVVSLNFIAGNPVNFQLVIDTGYAAGLRTEDVFGGMPYGEFVEGILSLDGLADFKEFLELMRGFTGASQASLYVIKGERLEPRSGASNDDSALFAFESIPETTRLHLRVAESGEEYSFTDEAAIQTAIEQDGVAPSEFVARLVFGDSDRYLLRLVFPEDTKPAEAREAVKRARSGLDLAQRLLPAEAVNNGQSEPSVDVRFTVGFLDNLGVGALLTQADGQVIGYNHTWQKMLNDTRPGDDYRDFVKLLSAVNAPEVERSITSHFLPTAADDSSGDLRLTVELPSGGKARMTVIRFTPTEDDLSACFVLMPASTPAGNGCGLVTNHRLWTSILDALQVSLLAVAGCSEKLGHELYGRMGDKGNVYLREMNEATRQLSGMLTEVDTMLKQTREVESAQPTDLNLLVSEALDKVRQWYPEADVDCRFEDLPKIRTCRRKLLTIIRNLISNAVKFNNGPQVVITVKAEIDNEYCRITVADNGIGIPARWLHQIFDFFFRVPGQKTSALPGNGMGLAITRQLVLGLGGKISAASKVGEGTCMTVSLPDQPVSTDEG